jgi:hypothetical protein
MGVIIDHDLSAADVNYLLTVRDILENPQDYDNTEPGETAANVTVIRNETDLSKTQVSYRSRDGDDSRGFGESGKGWLRTHGPSIEGKRFGPRSVELTDQGYKLVAEIEQSQSPGAGEADPANGVSGEEIARINEELSDIRESIENISADLQAIQESETGAIDAEMASKLDAISRAVPQQQFVFSEVFGIDMADVQATAVDDEDGIQQLRVAAHNHLTQSITEGDGVDDSADHETVQEDHGEAESPSE